MALHRGKNGPSKALARTRQISSCNKSKKVEMSLELIKTRLGVGFDPAR